MPLTAAAIPLAGPDSEHVGSTRLPLICRLDQLNLYYWPLSDGVLSMKDLNFKPLSGILLIDNQNLIPVVVYTHLAPEHLELLSV